MSSPPTKLDQRIRKAAFAYVCKLVAKQGFLTRAQLHQKTGVFACGGERFSLIHPRWGGYRPKQMSHLLSIMSAHAGHARYGTPVPKPPTGDQVACIHYLFRGNPPDPKAAQNRYLLDAWDQRVPVLYFLETDRRSFVPTLAYIESWEPEEHRVRVIFSSFKNHGTATEILARSYAEVKRKLRLHQGKFREDLNKAYKGRCAISGLSEAELLEAAHIIPDHQGGPPKVSNGLLLSRIHHAAFDTNLIGITPGYRVVVSQRLWEQDSRRSDLLALLKKINDKRIRLPHRKKDWPDKASLERRYKEFQAADLQ